MDTKKQFNLLFPTLDKSLAIDVSLSSSESDGALEYFTMTFSASLDGFNHGGFELVGIRDNADLEKSSIDMYSINNFDLNSLTPFLQSINGAKTHMGNILKDPIGVAFSNTIAALNHLPNINNDTITVFELLKKLGACINVGISYRNAFESNSEELLSDLNALIEPFLSDFKNKSIL